MVDHMCSFCWKNLYTIFLFCYYKSVHQLFAFALKSFRTNTRIRGGSNGYDDRTPSTVNSNRGTHPPYVHSHCSIENQRGKFGPTARPKLLLYPKLSTVSSISIDNSGQSWTICSSNFSKSNGPPLLSNSFTISFQSSATHPEAIWCDCVEGKRIRWHLSLPTIPTGAAVSATNAR